MKQVKKSGAKIFLMIFAILAVFVIAWFVTELAIASINLKYNKTTWENYNHTGIIYNQHDFEDLRYGFGNVAKNGCGAIAVYNILTLENKTINLAELLYKFDAHGENLFGLAGTRASKMISVLKEYDFQVEYSLKKSNFEKIAKNNKYAIFLYVGIESFKPFGHYQLLYDFNGENFQTINITGRYSFEDITKKDNTFLTMMIGVS